MQSQVYELRIMLSIYLAHYRQHVFLEVKRIYQHSVHHV